MFGNKKKLREAESKLNILAHKDLLNIKSFNKWFCDDTKPNEIYAHSGIFLRTDKLSCHHIIDYYHSLTNEPKEVVESLEDTHYHLLVKFEDMITKDWLNR